MSGPGLLAASMLAATFVRPLERVSSMDPAMVRSVYDSMAVSLVGETPLAIDYVARPYRLVPGCCELPVVTRGGSNYVLKIRKPEAGGHRPTAAEVVRTLERLRDPRVVSPNAWIMKDVDAVTAEDAETVEIRLRRRVRYFPWLLAMSPCAVMDCEGEGGGPFKLKRWRKNHDMVFTRRHPPKLSAAGMPFDTVQYLVIDDPSTQWLMFLRGEVDFLGEIPRDNWDSVVGENGELSPALARRGIRLYSQPTLTVGYIGFNLRDPVVGDNRQLRQALNCAFDYAEWNRFYRGRTVEANGPVPPGVPERLETPFPYRYDLEKAKRLLAEAGYRDGIDPETGRRLELTLAIGRASSESREAGELLASFFGRIGIRLELSFMTWDAFLKAVNDGHVQLYRMAWVGDYPDVQNFMQLFYGPNRSPGVNHSDYANPEYDAAYEREDFIRCQEIVREDCPWIFLEFGVANSLAGPRVGNFVPSDFPYGSEQFLTVREESPPASGGDHR